MQLPLQINWGEEVYEEPTGQNVTNHKEAVINTTHLKILKKIFLCEHSWRYPCRLQFRGTLQIDK